ncbi:uncharacterized protein BP5553_03488 [Venustampulla echinocandica]|uniref:Uncharacterized protein n=1 Tax=Venustampulla echinocandica TaxID=2656787 RepID=A0A370TUI3_9HELO|nr:uncharacterized protein BP5553_03488 [Venustampulla echinocandica]RDL39148.1 hypothetical protein BP5553_03488 [Venustampulla echinocandica]
MARVTRSRKINIAEDNTAIATQEPLLDISAKGQPLTELTNHEGGADTMTVEGSSIPAQLKQLKAAYRDAISSGKRIRKPRNKRTGHQEEQREAVDEGHTVENGENQPENIDSEAVCPPAPAIEGSVASLLNNSTTVDLTVGLLVHQAPDPLATTRRATRQQLAKQQVGQYYSSVLLRRYGPSSMNERRQPDYSLITSLFGGRRAGSSRARNVPIDDNTTLHDITPTSTEALADYYLYLAEDAGIKSTPEVKSLFRLGDQTREDSLSSEDTIQDMVAEPNDAIRTQLKSPVKTLEEVERSCGEQNDSTTADISDEDSFIEQITCRSPAKPVSRIEDSVEALDKLEEAIDALDQAALAEHIVSPEKIRAKARRGETSTQLGSKAQRDQIMASHNALAQATHELRPSKQKSQNAGYASMRVKSTAPRQPPNLKKATSMTFHPVVAENKKLVVAQRKVESASKAPPKRPVSLLPPKQPAKSTKPPTRPTFELPGEAISRRLKEQREARLAQREANEDAIAKTVTAPKATTPYKPPTKPTFELPGEAISRRKREAHEARLKAQEEEERKRREFKAKPVRKSIVPEHMPRGNVASRARQSYIGLDNMEAGELSVTKRNSVAVARRVSQLLNQPNISAPRAPGSKGQPTRKPSTTSGPSMSGLTLQRTVSTKEVQIQRQRAKEIYNRDARLTEDIEKERLEREAAAKRARAEAAERGRQASREWAERQKVKKLVEAGKGMVPDNSPASQAGLKG